jgi:hypothetical protein
VKPLEFLSQSVNIYNHLSIYILLVPACKKVMSQTKLNKTESVFIIGEIHNGEKEER